MILKKSLKRGQAAVEYFVLLAAIVSLTLISARFFWPQIRDSVQKGYFPKAAERVVNADQGSGE